MLRVPASLLALLALLATLACAHGEHGADPVPGCPIEVRGAHVAVTVLPTGAAFDFSAPEGRVAELRSRAIGMAERYTELGGIYADPKTATTDFVPAQAKFETLPGGARVALTASDDWHAGQLRTVVEQWAGRMRALGGCPASAGGAGMIAHPW